MTVDEQRALNATFGEGIREIYEGPLRLFVIPRLRLPVGASPTEAFAIYCASPHTGY